jgi:hypothetical protein
MNVEIVYINNHVMKKYCLFWLFLFLNFGLYSQTPTDSVKEPKLRIEVVDGDTVYTADIDPVYVYATTPPVTKPPTAKEIQKYQKLVRNVKRVYPYAVVANEKLIALNQKLSTLKTNKEKKKALDDAEKEIRAQFEEELKKLTVTQGKILIKLIDRETGNTSYALVKELRGSISAVFWQSLARLFGSSLKTKYDPTGEDKVIEDIVQKIKKGEIK